MVRVIFDIAIKQENVWKTQPMFYLFYKEL